MGKPHLRLNLEISEKVTCVWVQRGSFRKENVRDLGGKKKRETREAEEMGCKRERGGG